LLGAGLIIGVCVGIVGTGGAFIIPALVYVFGMGQLKAQGTALLIGAWPVWFFPFIPYWRAGHYDLKTAVLLAIGIGLGGYFGARLVQNLPQDHVRKAFAVVLMGLALKMFFER
jgi:uncharacterized protein